MQEGSIPVSYTHLDVYKRQVKDLLKKAGIAVKVDDTDKTPGWKFSECEMRGIPVRIDLGPKDIEAGKAVLVRRDTREKIEVSLDNIAEEVQKLMDTIQKLSLIHI